MWEVLWADRASYDPDGYAASWRDLAFVEVSILG
jgi:hypothetical protein